MEMRGDYKLNFEHNNVTSHLRFIVAFIFIGLQLSQKLELIARIMKIQLPIHESLKDLTIAL